MSRLIWQALSQYRAMIAGILMLSGACFAALFLARQTITGLLHAEAERSALAWASYLSSQMEDIDAVFKGAQPSARSVEFLERAQKFGNVFLYKLFASNGQLLLVSDTMSAVEKNAYDLTTERKKFDEVIFQGSTFIETKDGTNKPDRPDLYSEAYLPVIRDGNLIGVFEVYLDVSEMAARYEKTVFGLGSALLIMVLLVGGVPGFMWLNAHYNRQVDERVRFLAFHDPLTALPNRDQFIGRLETLLAAPDRKYALLYVDIDRFKEFNDTLGHQAGDSLLCTVAENLRALAMPGDLLARLSGDEFAIAKRIEDPGDGDIAAEKVLGAFDQVLKIGGQTLRTSCSIGVAIAPDHARTSNDLMRCADMALYEAKHNGRSCYRVFDSAYEDQMVRRRAIEGKVAWAIENDRLELQLQPEYETRSGLLVGFEALIRIRMQDGSLMGAGEFIPVAEETGLIIKIGEWVLRRGCEIAGHWPDHLSLAVNLSPKQLQPDNLPELVSQILEETGMSPRQLGLEITENTLLGNSDAVIAQLNSLSDLGVQIIADDFGTGYSSLSHLWQLPFSKVKIDRSFVMRMEENQLANDVTEATIGLCHALGLQVTAEGVETLEQAKRLADFNCDRLQGYLLARPMSLADAAGVIARDVKARVDHAAAARGDKRAAG